MAMNKPIECKPGTGVLFHRKAEGNRPTLSGACNIDGVDYEVAGWERTSKAGKEYISLTIRPVTAHQQFPKRESEWQP